MIYLLIIFTVAVLFSWYKPDLTFWVFLTFYFDPGGYFQIYVYPAFEGSIKPADIFFFLLLLPLISPNVSLKNVWRDSSMISLLNTLLFISVYYIVVYGFLTTNYTWTEYLRFFLIKRRLDIYGFLMIIPAYIFTLRNFQPFLNILKWTAVFLPFLFIVTLSFDLDLIPVLSFERYKGDSVMRFSMVSTGQLPYVIYLSVGLLYFGYGIRKHFIFYVGAFLMLVISLLTLTKMTLAAIAIVVMLMFYLMSVLSPTKKIPFLIKGFSGIIFSLITLFIISPEFISNLTKLPMDLISILIQGKDTTGADFGRFNLEIPFQTKLFLESPLFGSGHTDYWYTKEGDYLGYGASDAPFIAALAMYGIVGIAVWLTLYLVILKRTFLIIRIIRASRSIYLNFLRAHTLEAITFIVFSTMLVNFIILQPHLLFIHFVRFEYLINLLIIYSMMLALYKGYVQFSDVERNNSVVRYNSF